MTRAISGEVLIAAIGTNEGSTRAEHVVLVAVADYKVHSLT